MRPFEVVNDRAFHCLMKTGRPHYWIPSSSTVIRDTKLVFARTRNRIAHLLQVSSLSCPVVSVYTNPYQEHPGSLHFATDCWTSPNHHAYVAFTVHFEQEGVPFSLLLDFLALPKSHSGMNLAIAFEGLLNDFGIADKVSRWFKFMAVLRD